jgi:hypothetical protein
MEKFTTFLVVIRNCHATCLIYKPILIINYYNKPNSYGETTFLVKLELELSSHVLLNTPSQRQTFNDLCPYVHYRLLCYAIQFFNNGACNITLEFLNNHLQIIYSLSQLEQVSCIKQKLKNNLKIFCGKFNVWYTLIVCTFF